MIETLMVGTGIILAVGLGGVFLPFRVVITRLIDSLVVYLNSKNKVWNNSVLLEITSYYLTNRDTQWCTKCVGFWVGLVLHFWMPLTPSCFLDGALFITVGWLLGIVNNLVLRWTF